MDQDVAWYKGRPRPRPPHCVRWGPSSPRPERGTAAAYFSAHVCCGQTVAHLANCWALLFLHDRPILLSSVTSIIPPLARSSNEGFWKINLVFCKLWSVFICVVRPVHTSIGAWRNWLSSYSYDYELRQYNRDSWDSLKIHRVNTIVLLRQESWKHRGGCLG